MGDCKALGLGVAGFRDLTGLGVRGFRNLYLLASPMIRYL